MLTVSDVKFVPLPRDTCAGCDRPDLELGRVTPGHAGSDRQLCIDCHFGLPRWLWNICPACDYRQPGHRCHKCGTATVPGVYAVPEGDTCDEDPEP